MNELKWKELAAALEFWAGYYESQKQNEISNKMFNRGTAGAYRNLAKHIQEFGDLSKFVQAAHREAAQ